MFENIHFCAFVNTWEKYYDRFSLQNSNDRTLELNEILTKIQLMGCFEGVELVYPKHINVQNYDTVYNMILEKNLEVAGIAASVSSLDFFKEGALTSDDVEIRQNAIRRINETAALAEAINTKNVITWLGRDGFDYPFQVNYSHCWERLKDAYTQICSAHPKINICLNYKIKEPCTWLFVSSAAKALLLIKEVGMDNLGVCLDCGHALAAYENISESIALLSYHKRLFHTHINDNTRFWDDDLSIGSVHFLEMFEMVYWLNRTNFKGWLSFDPHIKSGDTDKFMMNGVNFVKGMMKVLNQLGEEKIEDAINCRDVAQIMSLIQKELFQ